MHILVLFLLACLLLQAFWIVAQAREVRRLERELTRWKVDADQLLDRAKLKENECAKLNDALRNVTNGKQAAEHTSSYWKESAENLNQQVLTLERQLQAFAERVRPVKKRRLQ